MIVSKVIDFVTLSSKGQEIANCAHTAYWMATSSAHANERVFQEKMLLASFHKISELLGYQLVKIEAAEAAE